MPTILIDAMEQRDVAVFDVPESYLQTEIKSDKQILLWIRDKLWDIMCELNSDYKPYVQYENGKKFLYVKVLRAIYGRIESAVLWYNFYVKTLKDLGFSINKYDRCVTKKTIDGKQCPTVWYVDDNKLLHVNWSSPRRQLFIHGISFEWTTKLCINFLNQFLFYFHI